MSQAAKAQEPSMEEILASIRRIIADDDAKPAAKAAEPTPAAKTPPPAAAAPAAKAPPPAAKAAPPPPAAAEEEAGMNQDDIDAMLAGLDAAPAAAPAAKAPEPEPEPEPEAGPDIFDLTESMTVVEPVPTPPPPPAPSFRKIDSQPDVVFEEPAPRPVEPPRADFAPAADYAPSNDRPLLSQNTSAMVDSAFNTLAQTVLIQNARTLEDLVKEMLRPMLKHWLDDNLPGMVERLVRAEIERVSRGRQ
jgi:cell pole-organizing protein PopZ